MPKLPINKLDMDEAWPDDWWEYLAEVENSDWSDYDQHPWQWYPTREALLKQGWTSVTINKKHKNVTVANWLGQMGAEFKYDWTEFLIKDSKYATLVILKYA